MVLAEAVGTFAILACVVLLRDPVLMYTGLLAMQLLLFPDMAWLVVAVGVFATMSMYMSHDIVLGDDKTFFVQVDRGIRSTTWFVLVMIACGYIFQFARRFMKDGYMGAWEVLVKEFPIALVIATTHAVDIHADGTLFDNLGVAFQYGTTLMHHSVKNLMILFNAAFMRSPRQ
jgi:hypothetical protein